MNGAIASIAYEFCGLEQGFFKILFNLLSELKQSKYVYSTLSWLLAKFVTEDS
jgi:hypothetical protein